MRPGLKPCPGCLHEGTWVWYNVFPELFVTIIFTNCFSWKTCHLIHLLVLYWQKVRRTGSIKWMHTGTVHDADQESMSLAASVEALSVLNACVEMKKNSGMAPPTLFKCYETKSLQPKLVGTCMPQVVVIIQNHSWKNSGQPKLLKSAPALKKTQRLSRISPLWFPVLRNLDWQSFGRTNSCFFSWNSQNSLKPEVKQNAALFRRYAARTTALISIYSDLTIPGHLPASHTNQFWHQSYPKCVCLLGMLFTLNVFADDDFRSFESPSFITIWIDLRHFFNAIAEIVEILRIVMLAGAFAHLQALTPFKLRQEPGNLGTFKRDMATMPLQHWTKEDQDPIQLRSVMVFWQLISNLPSGLVSKERLVRNTFLVAEITRSRGEASMVKSTSIEVW